ncbi:MAG TPA: sensor histidine kinase [Thermoleophilaceae bacterium]|jgi:signal transduction histidine kinase
MRTLIRRLEPPRLDALIALGLLVAAELEAALEAVSVPRAVDGLLVLGFTVPLAWRRRAPLTVFALATATVVAYGEVEKSGAHQTLIFALALASFTAGYELPLRRAWLAPAMVVAADALAVFVLGQSGGDAVFVAIFYVSPWAFARALRARGRRVDELAERAGRLELERAEVESRAVQAERARIARELHDVVSHSISVIAVQSQAIRRRLGPEQEREAADLAGVETTARQAMGEMRRLLGVLRADGASPPLAPHPGLDQLSQLLGQVRAAGLQVDLRVQGDPQPLPPGVDLAAYRIVQEGLTNSLKHSGAGHARVEVRYEDAAVGLTIADDGEGAGATESSGHGLVGMRERVALYGGTLEIHSHVEDGGFRVLASLPVQRNGTP